MCVMSGDAAAMVDDHQVAVGMIPPCELNHARLAGAHRIAPVSLYVDAGMELRVTSKGISTIAKVASNTYRGGNCGMFLVLRFKLRVGLRFKLCFGLLI